MYSIKNSVPLHEMEKFSFFTLPDNLFWLINTILAFPVIRAFEKEKLIFRIVN